MRYQSGTLFLFLLVLGFSHFDIEDPTIIWIENEQGHNVTSLQVVAFNEIKPLYLKSDGTVRNWKVEPDLPKGLKLTSYPPTIAGTPTEVMTKTVFTITVTGMNCSIPLEFPITITGCEYGNYLYPRFRGSGDGLFILSKDGTTYVNETVSSTSYKPICIPQQSYDYIFVCGSKAIICYFFLEDDYKSYYLSLHLESNHNKTGWLETKATKKPVIHFPSLISSSSSENLYYFIEMEGIYANVTFTPALPSSLQFDELTCSLSGIVKETMSQEITITTSNSIGTTSFVFTLSVDTCPEGLEPMTLALRRNKYSERWRVMNENGVVLFDQETDYRTNSHMICWKPGSYTFELSAVDDFHWESFVGLNVEDSYGVLAEFNLPASVHRLKRTFNYKYLITKQSEWLFTKKEVNEKWTRASFNDRKWETGKDGLWGRFHVESGVMYLRKKIEVGEIDAFTTVFFDIKHSEECAITLIVNEHVIVSLSGKSSHPTGYTRISVPVSYLNKRSSILAIQVSRAEGAAVESPIEFDLQSLVVSTSCILQSLNGKASDYQEGASTMNKPKNAFTPTNREYWTVYHYPAILRFTFANHMHTIVNKVYLGKTEYATPTELRIEGVNVDNSTVVLYSVRKQTFLADQSETIHLENHQAFPAYQIVYLNSTNGSSIGVSDIRFYSCTDRSCKKKGSYSLSYAGETQFGKCSWFHSGKKQMHCVEDDLEVKWISDTSTCLSTFPQRHTSYIDWKFEITNMVVSEWSEKETVIRQLITENLKVSDSEISFIVIYDASDDDTVILKGVSRFTLEREIGDYILKHLKLISFDELIQKYLSTHTKKYTGVITEIALHESIDPHSVVLVIVTVAISSLLFISFYFCFISCRMKGERKSLYHRKGKGEHENLICRVCFIPEYL